MTPSLRLAEQAPKTTESEKRRKKREISLLCHESQRCRPLALTQIFLLSFVQRIYWSSCFFFSLFLCSLLFSLSLSLSLYLALCVATKRARPSTSPKPIPFSLPRLVLCPSPTPRLFPPPPPLPISFPITTREISQRVVDLVGRG